MKYEEILEHVLSAGSNSLNVFGGRFQGGYEIQQYPDEIARLLFDYQDLEVQNFLEIGTASAGNTRLLSEFLQIHNIYTMDLNVHPSIPKARKSNLDNLKATGKICHFYGDSHSAEARQWLHSHNVKFGLVFVDGDHTEKGIEQDTKLIIPLLANMALVMYHDICIPVGTQQFDRRMKQGEFPELRHLYDYVGSNKSAIRHGYKHGNKPKGISVYRHG
jgi:hypothetical protein